MEIRKAKALEEMQRLKEISTQIGINYNSLEELLESVKTRKLLKRNNYHQQKINDLIEQELNENFEN